MRFLIPLSWGSPPPSQLLSPANFPTAIPGGYALRSRREGRRHNTTKTDNEKSNRMKNPFTPEDRDRLIWAALTLAADAVLSMQPVREALEPIRNFANSLADELGFAPLFPTQSCGKR